jgi:PAS domain S-box-containing protein
MIKKKGYLSTVLGIFLLPGLYLAGMYNYLLFHSLAELFSVVVAVGIFMVAWNSRRFMENNYLLFLGIAYLSVGGLDTLHTLGYLGMGIFEGYKTNLPTQLWIAARYVESLSLLIAPLLFGRKLKINSVFLVYVTVFVLLLVAIFYWDIFPTCFVEGVGLTSFKKISEYVISLVLLGSIYLLVQKRREFDSSVFRLLVASIIVTIGSELTFTFYVHAYGISNLIGHYFKIISYYLIYKAIIQTGLMKPYDLLFRNLKESEEAVRGSEARARALLNAPTESALLIDSEGLIIALNETAHQRLGKSTDKLVGMNLYDILPPDIAKIEKAKADEVFRSGKPVRFESKRQGRWFDQTDYPVFASHGKICQVAVFAHDITDYKEAEEALLKARDKLEQQVKERTANLAETNEQLRREIEERKQMEKVLQKSQVELRHLSSRLLEVQENERKRIAGELHDSIGQSLTAIKFGLENALNGISQDSAKESAELMEALIPVVQQASEEVRQIHTNLRPSLLDDLGVMTTISWFCREFEKVYTGIRIEKQMDIEEKEVPELLKIVIFRVLQEALNNVSKHGKADLVRLSMKRTGTKIELIIEDNGQGFDVKHLRSVKESQIGFGLTSMKERTELSGGVFAIESTPRAGTVVRASWPV